MWLKRAQKGAWLPIASSCVRGSLLPSTSQCSHFDYHPIADLLSGSNTIPLRTVESLLNFGV